jgi:ATP-dependent Clp protease ATP-binding subunit ClpB
VLDGGRLTDGQGRAVDFRNTVIILTSNLGSTLIQEMTHKGQSNNIRAPLMKIISECLRPEFINRIDDTVIFRPLSEDNIREKTSLQINILKNHLKQKGLTLDISEQGIDFISEAGFSPVYGARSIKIAIQQELENPLARAILDNQFISEKIIKVFVEGNRLIISNHTPSD